ncbi:MAG: hypothetical protein V8Q54_00980, partial [Alistipes senegalensis]
LFPASTTTYCSFTKNHKNFWSFDLNVRVNEDANLPYSLFEFIKLGKEGQIQELRNLDGRLPRSRVQLLVPADGRPALCRRAGQASSPDWPGQKMIYDRLRRIAPARPLGRQHPGYDRCHGRRSRDRHARRTATSSGSATSA